MSKRPLISCVIPVYNGAATIDRAVRSVLEQTRVPEEIIVVDDGSTDATPERLAVYQNSIRVIRKSNGGSSEARNFGVTEATGEWIALLDGDDWWLPEKNEKMVDLALASPDRIFWHCGSLVHQISTGREIASRFEKLNGDVSKRLLLGNVVCTSSVLVRRTEWVACGGMDSSAIPCEDWDLWLRLAQRGPFGCHPERLVVYRQNDAGICQGNPIKARKADRFILNRVLDSHPEISSELRKSALAAHHYRCGMDAYSSGDLKFARECFEHSLRLAWHPKAARAYCETYMGRRLIEVLRWSKRRIESWTRTRIYHR